MASIIFNTLKNTVKSQDNYTYVDFFFDIQENLIKESNYLTTKGTGRDIKVSYDLNAIRNSIKNLFNTIPGERFLQPEYGTDLRRYIFEGITESIGNIIARTIQIAINNWEPRCRILQLWVIGKPDENSFEIQLVLSIPFLTEPLNLKGLLTRNGYTII